MLNRLVRVILLLSFSAIIPFCCQKNNEKDLTEISEQYIEPYRPCDSTSPRNKIQKKVSKGLILESVSKFPESKTENPQHSIDLNFRSEDLSAENTRIDIYVSARNRLGKIMIGHTWIPREHPPVHLWKPGSCFPVSCLVNLPMSRNSMTWDIEARISAQNGGVTVINLGQVTLG